MLTKSDLKTIFDKILEKSNGNRTKAARSCGLTTKATYDWEKAGFIKLETKQKVLQTWLELNFIETIEYLFNRSVERTGDLLHTNLSTMYTNAIEATGKESFTGPFNHFLQFKTRHRGLIRDQVEFEIADMTAFLEEKAMELGIELPERPIEDMSTSELLANVEIIGKYYGKNPLTAENFALGELSLPKVAVKPIIQTFETVCFDQQIPEPEQQADMGWTPYISPYTNQGAAMLEPQAGPALNPWQGW
jgi:hypothetical protein